LLLRAVQLASYVYMLVMFAVTGLPALLLLGRQLFRPLSVPFVLLLAVAERFKARFRPGLLFIAVYFICTNARHLEPFPASGSVDHFVGDCLAASLFSLWVGFGVLLASGYITVSKDIVDKPEYKRLTGFFLWDSALGSMIIIAITKIYAGPSDWFGLTVGAVIAISHIRFNLGFIAKVRRYYSPVASDCSVAMELTSPYILHLSDLHLTATGAKRTEGGASGNDNLAWLTGNLVQSRRPKYLIITGDIVDTGSPLEWSQAGGILETLKEQGMRVLTCPGNHDLATAYDDIGYFFVRAGAINRQPLVNGSKLVAYLEMAVKLEPELRYEDTPLADILKREVQPAREIAEEWQKAADSAHERLTALSSTSPTKPKRKGQPSDLLALQRVDWPLASAFLNPLVERAMEYFSPPEFLSGSAARERWVRDFTQRSSCAFSLIETAVRWSRLWTQVFPLRLYAEQEEIEFFIVNSVAPDSGALGSAFGRLASEQINRLKRYLLSTKAKVAVILMHNPICGWDEETKDRHSRFRVDVQRWGLLAHDANECQQLVEIMNSNSNETLRQILLCVGHRHGSSRIGRPRQYANDPILESSGWILESAALPDLSISPRSDRTSDLIVCDREKSGLLQPARMSFSALAQFTSARPGKNLGPIGVQ